MKSKSYVDKGQQASMNHIRPTISVNVVNEFTRKESQLQLHSVDWYDYAPKEIELSAFMHQLFVKQRKCCMVRICESRKSEAPLLVKLLALKLVEYLGTMKADLHKIEIELLGIRQNDVMNMLTDVTKTTNIHRKENKTLWPRLKLFSMLTLLQWIGTTYVQLVSAGRQHEYLDLTLYLYDEANRLNKVNVVTIQVYLDELDRHNKVALQGFLQNSKIAQKSNKSMLNTFLSDYLTDKDDWLTWLVFDMPTVEGVCSITEDMFLLANAAHERFSQQRQKDSYYFDTTILLPGTAVFCPHIERKQSELSKRPKTIGSQLSFIEKLTYKLQYNYKDPDEPHNDWYRNVAKVFNELIKATLIFYDQMYNEVIDNIFKAGNSLAFVQELQRYNAEYKAANKACIDLAKKLERANHERLSNTSLKSRSNESTMSTASTGSTKQKCADKEYGKKLMQNLMEKEKILLDTLKSV